MKNKVFIFLLTITFLTACHRESARIDCKLNIDVNTSVKLYEVKAFSYKFADSVTVKPQGNFHFNVNTEQPAFYQLISKDFRTINLLIAPKDNISVEINSDNHIVKGSKENILLTTFYDSLLNAKNRLQQLEEQYELADDTQKPAIEEKYKKTINDHKRYSKGLIIANLNSLVCIPILYQQLVGDQFLFDKSKDLQFFKLAVDSLQVYYPQQRNVKALSEDFNSRLLQFNRYKLMQSVEKMDTLDFPEVQYRDINGREVTLSKLAKKNVLLYFWSSTNTACMEMLPHLKRIYNTFKNSGFTIYAVNIEKDNKRWMQIVKQEELPWINVNDTLFETSNARMFYNINTIPSSILINPVDKTIIAKDLTIKQLDSYLQDVSE